MDLMTILFVAMVYWTLGCLVLSCNENRSDRALNTAIILLWPIFIVYVLVYLILKCMFQIGKKRRDK